MARLIENHSPNSASVPATEMLCPTGASTGYGSQHSGRGANSDFSGQLVVASLELGHARPLSLRHDRLTTAEPISDGARISATSRGVRRRRVVGRVDELTAVRWLALEDLEAWEPALCEDPSLNPQLVRIRAAVRNMATGAGAPVA